MKKVKSQKKEPSAWIVSAKDRGRKSIKNDKIYLKDKEQFEIELFNPLTVSVLAKVKLNDSFISTSGLVISPGERIYLDCFIDDRKKFIFKTYKVEDSEDSKEAIKNNGLVEVYFYSEKVLTLPPMWNTNNTFYSTGYTGQGHHQYYRLETNGTTTGVLGSENKFFCNSIPVATTETILLQSNSNTDLNIETGRIMKGSSSNQVFVNINMDFEYYTCAKTIIQILPESIRPIYSYELKNKNKNSSFVDILTKLKDLYESGVLTEEEFESKKKEILDRL